MAYRALKRRINGASFEELLGVMDTVTRPEAKRLARLHGHPWPKVIRELHRRARAGYEAPIQLAPPEPLAAALIHGAERLAAEANRGP